MRTIDGSRGEGGGQVFRFAVALAAAATTPVRVTRIRAGRPEPGLKPQHLVAARSLAELTGGELEGAFPGSTDVTFRPGPLVGGEHEVQIPTAGSLPLLLQALLPPMIASGREFRLSLSGGTDVPFAPGWDYLTGVHFRHLEEIGASVEGTLHARGYYPQGGGRVSVHVRPAALRPHDFSIRGPLRSVAARAHANGLPKEILHRATETLAESLAGAGLPARVEIEHHRGPGRGMGVSALATYDRGVLGSDALGRPGKRAEEVAIDAASALAAEHASGAGVDVHSADMLPIYLALSGGGAYRARHLTQHAKTALDLIPEFVPVRFETEREGDLVEVRVA